MNKHDNWPCRVGHAGSGQALALAEWTDLDLLLKHCLSFRCSPALLLEVQLLLSRLQKRLQ